MIIVIMICIIVLLSIVAYIGLNNDLFETLGMICVGLVVVTSIIMFCMVIECVAVHIPIVRKQKLAEYEQTYSAISQMINNNDNAVITLSSQIAEYNADVLKGRMMQDNILVSCLDYDFYYDLPLIELNNER